METYARQILNYESDLTASDDIMQKAQTFLLALDAIHARECLEMWSVPPGLLAVQASPLTSSIPCRATMGTLASIVSVKTPLSFSNRKMSRRLSSKKRLGAASSELLFARGVNQTLSDKAFQCWPTFDFLQKDWEGRSR